MNMNYVEGAGTRGQEQLVVPRQVVAEIGKVKDLEAADGVPSCLALSRTERISRKHGDFMSSTRESLAESVNRFGRSSVGVGWCEIRRYFQNAHERLALLVGYSGCRPPDLGLGYRVATHFFDISWYRFLIG